MDKKVESILADYLIQLQTLFDKNLIGLYLTESLALDDYQENKSDIDFTTVVKETLNDSQISSLRTIHKNIHEKYPTIILEGHYITEKELGKSEKDIDPVITYYNNEVSKSYFNINIITWFTLKKYEITVWGIPSGSLPFDVSEHELLSYVIENVNSYWVNWLRKIKKYSQRGFHGLTKDAAEWGVSGISRMYYTLSQVDVASKSKSCIFAMENSSEKYRKIIKEALYIRSGKGNKQYIFPFKRRRDLIMYMDFLTEECNRLYNYKK